MNTDLVFIDTETTSLRHDRRAWEIGIIARTGSKDVEHHWFIDINDLDLGNADVMSLKVGRFFERHPQMRLDREASYADCETEADALLQVERITRGAHLIGAVVSFDADVLSQRMRANGICPSWHYHLCCVENLAVGWLAARGNPIQPPWKSDDLSEALGIAVSDEDRHTALGDARWARTIYDAVMGSSVF